MIFHAMTDLSRFCMQVPVMVNPVATVFAQVRQLCVWFMTLVILPLMMMGVWAWLFWAHGWAAASLYAVLAIAFVANAFSEWGRALSHLCCCCMKSLPGFRRLQQAWLDVRRYAWVIWQVVLASPVVHGCAVVLQSLLPVNFFDSFWGRRWASDVLLKLQSPWSGWPASRAVTKATRRQPRLSLSGAGRVKGFGQEKLSSVDVVLPNTSVSDSAWQTPAQHKPQPVGMQVCKLLLVSTGCVLPDEGTQDSPRGVVVDVDSMHRAANAVADERSPMPIRNLNPALFTAMRGLPELPSDPLRMAVMQLKLLVKALNNHAIFDEFSKQKWNSKCSDVDIDWTMGDVFAWHCGASLIDFSADCTQKDVIALLRDDALECHLLYTLLKVLRFGFEYTRSLDNQGVLDELMCVFHLHLPHFECLYAEASSDTCLRDAIWQPWALPEVCSRLGAFGAYLLDQYDDSPYYHDFLRMEVSVYTWVCKGDSWHKQDSPESPQCYDLLRRNHQHLASVIDVDAHQLIVDRLDHKLMREVLASSVRVFRSAIAMHVNNFPDDMVDDFPHLVASLRYHLRHYTGLDFLSPYTEGLCSSNGFRRIPAFMRIPSF